MFWERNVTESMIATERTNHENSRDAFWIKGRATTSHRPEDLRILNSLKETYDPFYIPYPGFVTKYLSIGMKEKVFNGLSGSVIYLVLHLRVCRSICNWFIRKYFQMFLIILFSHARRALHVLPARWMLLLTEWRKGSGYENRILPHRSSFLPPAYLSNEVEQAHHS